MVFNNNNNNDDDEIDDNAINVAAITTDDDNVDNDQNCHTRTADEISNQVASIVAAANSTNSADLSFSLKTTYQINTSASNTTVPSTCTNTSTVATTAVTMSVEPKLANTTRKMFECDVCNMRFSNGANMRRHRMRHTGVKPYECRICQKRFFRKDHLAEHFTTHTKTLPYHCPICDRGFQRQIAMRAHFQNEHVGQHELVKSCPLCSYRASSMKSLRVHFYNRHGVDLDNPGPSSTILVSAKHLSTSSIIDSLMNENSNSSSSNLNMNLNGNSNSTNYHFPNSNDNGNNNSIINGNALSVTLTSAVNDTRTYSDSGDSTGARSVDNLTPPMHFLTPQVEISMASDQDSNLHFDHEKEQRTKSSGSVSKMEYMTTNSLRSPPYLQPIIQDIETNSTGTNSNNMNNNIIPSISLIPIKQEIHSDDSYYESNTYPITSSSSSSSSSLNNNTNSISTTIMTMTPSNGLLSSIKKTTCAAVSISPLHPITSIANNSLSSLIKVSPLKSLLKDEIKRKISSTVTSSTATTVTTINNAIGNNNRTANMYSGGGAIGQLNSQTMIVWPNFTKSASQLEQTQQLIADMKCIFCGICFPDQTLYFLHIGCHSDSNPWKCNICGEQCSNIYEFNSHLLSKSH